MADDKDTQNDRITLIVSLFAAAAAAAAAAGLICFFGLTDPTVCAAFGAVTSAIIALIIKEFLQRARKHARPTSLNRPAESSKRKPSITLEDDELDVPEILDPADANEEEKPNDSEACTDGIIGAVNASKFNSENETPSKESANNDQDDRIEHDEKSTESANDSAAKGNSLERESDQDLAAALNRKRFANRVAIACLASGIATAAVVVIALNQFSATEDSLDESPSPIVEESSSNSSSTASASNESLIPEISSPRALPAEEDDEEPDIIITWEFEENEPAEIPDESIPDSPEEHPITSDSVSSDSASSSMSDSASSGASSMSASVA